MTTVSPASNDDLLPRLPATPPRNEAGVLRRGGGALVLVAVITQITDLLLNDAFEPDHYFSLFTIQSSLINVVVLLTGGVLALRWRTDPELFSGVRASTVAYATVTFLVYNLLLRGDPADAPGFVGLQWPGEILHVYVPIFILLEWLFAPGRPAVEWGRLGITITYPLLWLGFTLVHGAASQWYPYPFIDPDGPGGPVSVLVYVVVLFSFIIAVAALAILVSRIGARTARERAARSAP
jgi:hypothetical protein